MFLKKAIEVMVRGEDGRWDHRVGGGLVGALILAFAVACAGAGAGAAKIWKKKKEKEISR